MPKIKSFADLLKLLAVLFISFLAVHGFIVIPNQEGVVAVLTPTLTERFYSIFGGTLVVLSYLILLGIIILILMAIWSYFRNRHKPDMPSLELQAIIKLEATLGAKLDRLTEIMEHKKNGKTTKTN